MPLRMRYKSASSHGIRVGSGEETKPAENSLSWQTKPPWSGMSVFRGSIAEYPGVVVDNFANCERGRVFFLSHCHKGTLKLGQRSHTIGILTADFVFVIMQIT